MRQTCTHRFSHLFHILGECENNAKIMRAHLGLAPRRLPHNSPGPPGCPREPTGSPGEPTHHIPGAGTQEGAADPRATGRHPGDGRRRLGPFGRHLCGCVGRVWWVHGGAGVMGAWRKLNVYILSWQCIW